MTAEAATADVDLACWFCAAPFARAAVEQDGLLMPRRPGEGGPYLRYPCRACGRTSQVERNRAGALLAGPPPIVPLADRLLGLFDREHALELARKREHERRRPGRRAWFFGPYADELVAAGWRPGQARPAPAGPAPRGPAGGREAPEGATGGHEPPPRPRAPSAPPPAAPPPPPPGPLEVLGLPPGSTRDAVEAAFRELAKRYHPDRFAALDPEFQALAERRFKELSAARDAALLDAPEAPPPP